jgi:hypothetical protein
MANTRLSHSLLSLSSLSFSPPPHVSRPPTLMSLPPPQADPMPFTSEMDFQRAADPGARAPAAALVHQTPPVVAPTPAPSALMGSG